MNPSILRPSGTIPYPLSESRSPAPLPLVIRSGGQEVRSKQQTKPGPWPGNTVGTCLTTANGRIKTAYIICVRNNPFAITTVNRHHYNSNGHHNIIIDCNTATDHCDNRRIKRSRGACGSPKFGTLTGSSTMVQSSLLTYVVSIVLYSLSSVRP